MTMIPVCRYSISRRRVVLGSRTRGKRDGLRVWRPVWKDCAPCARSWTPGWTGLRIAWSSSTPGESSLSRFFRRTEGEAGGRSVVEEGEEKLIPRICSGEAKNDWVWLCPLTWTTAASAADVIRRWTGLPWGDSSTTRLDPCRFPRIEGNHRGAWRRLPVCWRWDDKANFIAS